MTNKDVKKDVLLLIYKKVNEEVINEYEGNNESFLSCPIEKLI